MPSDPKRIQAAFAAAVELAATERIAVLDRQCAGDAELRHRVEALLDAYDASGSFLENPAVQFAATDLHTPSGDFPLSEPPIHKSSAAEKQEAIGTRVGPYKLLQVLGEGGMGTVWVAEQTEPVKRRVALKLIKAGMDSAQVIRRFEAERQALAMMDHSHIAKVLDAGTTYDGRPFFVMELIKGVPITKYCDELNLSLRERLELFVPVCQAIQHAHQKGVIHRDIKPSNVLVAIQDGRPIAKVIDFGVAKALHQQLSDQSMYTEIGAIIGTLEYMSPEQAELSTLDIDTRADVYALGVLLYELLTGTTPLNRKQLQSAAYTEMLRMIREVDPPKPSTRLTDSKDSLASLAAHRRTEPARLTKDVRGELDWIVMRCLEKDRTRRYESASALARDVENYLQGDAVEASPPSPSYRMRKFLRRNKGPVTAASLVLLALIGGILGTTWGLVDANRSRAKAETKEKDALQAAASETLAKKDALDQKANALAAEAQAKQEAAIAAAVNRFLQKDLLNQADVAQQVLGQEELRDRDVKVRTLLDRAAKKLDGQFADQPLTEAAIRSTVGHVYIALGQYYDAQPHLERALKLNESLLGAEHHDTLASQLAIANLLFHLQKYDQAESILQNVLRIRTTKLGADHRDTLSAEEMLATTYMVLKKYDQAEALLMHVIETQSAQTSERSNLLIAKGNLAGLYMEQGKYDQADELLREVVQKLSDKFGSTHPQVMSAKYNLAKLIWKQKKFEEAESLLVGLLKDKQAQLGAEHPSTLTTLSLLSQTYESQKKNDLAASLWRQTYQQLAAKYGIDSPTTAWAHNNLLRVTKDLDQNGEPSLEKLQLLIATLGVQHPDVLKEKRRLASIYMFIKKFDRAKQLYEENIQSWVAKVGPQDSRTLSAEADLAILYDVRCQYDQALPRFQKILQVETEKPDNKDASLIRGCQGHIVSIYLAQGQDDKAEPILRQSIDEMWKKSDTPAWSQAHDLKLLGRILVKRKDFAAAEPILRESVVINERSPPNPSTKSEALLLLGAALSGNQKFDEAELRLTGGYEELMKLKPSPSFPEKLLNEKRIEALQWLVDLYTAWDKPDDAAKWEAERKEVDDASKAKK